MLTEYTHSVACALQPSNQQLMCHWVQHITQLSVSTIHLVVAHSVQQWFEYISRATQASVAMYLQMRGEIELVVKLRTFRHVDVPT